MGTPFCNACAERITTVFIKAGCMSLTKAIRFTRDVRMEAGKVTWPGGKETRMMTIMVFILVSLVAVYLLAIDFAIGSLINMILRG